jgi:hypothetical protein
MMAWNVLMLIAVAGATIAAKAAIEGQMSKSPAAANVIIGVLVVYGILIAIGFVYKSVQRANA